MKKLNYLLAGLFVLSIFSVTFVSCEGDDEGEPDKAYVGEWESAVYTNLSGADEKMVFNFTNTEFEDVVHQAAPGETLQEVAGIKGSIVSTDTEMEAEINEVSVMGGPYVDKNTDRATFDIMFGASVGALLDEEFTAKYVVEGNTMMLILPVNTPMGTVTDTLHLTKI